MFRSRTLATFLISSVFITPALAKCELSQYVFKDQKGNEAVVKSVRECFGWYSKRSGRSSKAACETENAVSPVIKKNYKNDYRLVGNRIIKISYKGKRYNIAEVVMVGVPSLVYLVVPNLMRFYGKVGRVLDAVTRAYALNSIVQLGHQNFGTLILVVVPGP